VPERPDWVDERAYPFADRWAAGLHFVDEGDGAPVLLVHGNPTWSFLYRHVVRLATAAPGVRCLAPDLPGFGLSAPGDDPTPAGLARALERFVLELDLRDVTLVVQDWGGPTGMWVAGRHPDRFAGFVVLNTWAWPAPRPGAALWSRAFGNDAVARRFPDLFVQLGTRRRLSAATIAHYARAARVPSVRAMIEAVDGARPWLTEVEQGLGALRDHPARLVWPTADPVFGAVGARAAWREVFATVAESELAGARHFCQEDDPEPIAAAIRASLS